MKAIDLFAGAGGFTEGARMAGVEVAWAGQPLADGGGFSWPQSPRHRAFLPGSTAG